MTKGGPMQVSQIRAARWAITGGLAAFLAIAAAGFPTQAHAFVCNGQFDILQKGYCSTTITQGCGTSFDAACPAGETCKTFNFVDPGDPEKDGADQLRISLAVGTSTITGPAGAPNQMTLHKVRFDLDCVANSGGNGTNSLCMDQGDVVEYMGDTTISTDCPGVTWTSSQPLGGVGANEVAFTPSAAIVIPQSCAPSQQSPPPACGGCKVEFGVRVVHQEPAGSDTTPQLVEEAAGYIQGQGDAVCNEGLTGSLQSGSTQTANIPICPSCTIDQCNLGCDEQVTGMCQAQTASTPCADTDGSSCTTAGCDGQGTCDQDHVVECWSLSVEKKACVAPAAAPAAGCPGGAIALTLQYTGSTISGPTTVVVTGSSGASVTYDLPSLTNGDVLTTASENGFTIDATAHGQSKLGSKTTVTINGVAEVLHTSCSCKATPDTNLALCDPMCLDSSSPDNTTGFKGAPSPLWTLVGLKDPTLGTETCGGGGTTGECQTALPAGGADVEFTYKITNTGTTTVSDLAVEDDKPGIIDASQIVPLDPG